MSCTLCEYYGDTVVNEHVDMSSENCPHYDEYILSNCVKMEEVRKDFVGLRKEYGVYEGKLLACEDGLSRLRCLIERVEAKRDELRVKMCELNERGGEMISEYPYVEKYKIVV